MCQDHLLVPINRTWR